MCNRCDKAMQLMQMQMKLTFNHELELARRAITAGQFKPERGKLLFDQSKRKDFVLVLETQHLFACFTVQMISDVYLYLRSNPSYLPPTVAQRVRHHLFKEDYVARANLDKPFIEQFYREGTRAAYWRQIWNETLNEVFAIVDVKELHVRYAQLKKDLAAQDFHPNLGYHPLHRPKPFARGDFAIQRLCDFLK